MDLITSLKEYVNVLENSGNFEVYKPLIEQGKATVTIVVGKGNRLSVVPAKTFEVDVQNLEQELKNAQNELKEATKTISKLEAEIENLKPEEEKTPIPEETAEVTPLSTRKVRRVKT